MTGLFARAREVRTRWDVLRHPFYQRWSRGELAPAELAFYAGQYRHAVVALADAAGHAGDGSHAEEERSHVSLWDGFLEFAGGDLAATPIPETLACAAAWSDPDRDLVTTLAALYAIEAAQPAISETKRAGLLAHYGASPDSAATGYFDVHAVLDLAHAGQGWKRLEAVMDPADEPRVVAEVERVLEANWRLLDGVQARAAGPA
ncbi:MAG TPA: iron-containing redox enzyme family protein [Solirubrobacteraceae bacterium]|jgi:pyrroloquinoline-quinone synthase|nr:iron-containing redox enzyme family protein [Solirubrobacteraceae bacterium]